MAETVLDRLRWWLRDYGKAILFLIAIAGAFVALGLWITRDFDKPAIEEDAEILRFGAYSFEKGPRPVVIVRLRDGSVRQLGVHRSATHHCRVGGQIRIVHRGDVVTVGRRGCTLPAT